MPSRLLLNAKVPLTAWATLGVVGAAPPTFASETPPLILPTPSAVNCPAATARPVELQPECSKTPGDVRWALQNIFTLPELRIFFAEHAEAVDLSVENSNPVVTELGRQLRSGEDVRESVERQVNEWLQQRIADLQQADRRYWREVIAQLKTLRATGKLAAEGSAV